MDTLPVDVLHHLVVIGMIRGKDLIALCRTYWKISRKINAQNGILFKRLLKSEFGVESSRNHREEYAKWTYSCVYYQFMDNEVHKVDEVPGVRSVTRMDNDLYILNSSRSLWKRGIYSKTAEWLHADVVQISSSERHVAFIDAEGQVWTFGRGMEGQLGYDSRSQFKPRMIEGFRNIKQVACGNLHTAFIDAEGQVWTFGRGLHGRLGHGFDMDFYAPRMIRGFKGVRRIACGGAHTVFLDAEGRPWTFGLGDHGQLGNGEDITTRKFAIEQFEPLLIEGFENLREIYCGYEQTAFIDQDGALWTFGDGQCSQLGHRNEKIYNKPTRVNYFRESRIKSFMSCYDRVFFIDERDDVWYAGTIPRKGGVTGPLMTTGGIVRVEKFGKLRWIYQDQVKNLTVFLK